LNYYFKNVEESTEDALKV